MLSLSEAMYLFGQVEVKRGLMAYGGATIRFVERAGWGNAMRWLLTGDDFGPDEGSKSGKDNGKWLIFSYITATMRLCQAKKKGSGHVKTVPHDTT